MDRYAGPRGLRAIKQERLEYRPAPTIIAAMANAVAPSCSLRISKPSSPIMGNWTQAIGAIVAGTARIVAR